MAILDARARVRLRRLGRSLGPAMARPKGLEPFRAAFGAGVALLVCGGLITFIGTGSLLDEAAGLFLIAPLGATAFLLFAVPNSPLAQPWSAIVGNTASALVAITVVLAGLPAVPAAGLAVFGAIAAMSLLRALHPPGGAVALATVLAAPTVLELGYRFALAPVMLDTVLLVLFATAFNRLTGRKYPFRQPADRSAHGTGDRPPDRRLAPTAEELQALLERFNQSTNIGTEDLGRILQAAEEAAAARRLQGLACGAVMSRDLVSVPPDAPLSAVAALFRRHRFKTLPVVSPEGGLCGLITQNDLIGRAWEAEETRQAGAIMTRELQSAAPATPIADLIPLLADGGVQAVPVVEDGRLQGIITRSDLLAVLAREWSL